MSGERDEPLKWQYLRLLGALACLAMVAVSDYTGRGETMWGYVGCAAFILAVMLNLGGPA